MRKLTLSLMLAGIVSPTISHAIGLGELVVDSGLNQPLNAEIELVATTPAEVNELKVRLAPAEIFKQIGIERPILLNKLVFTPTVENGRTIIKVNSLTPVTEPFLNFVVEVDWVQGKLLREYTVLLDPPTFAPSYAPVVTTPVNTFEEAEIVTGYEGAAYEAPGYADPSYVATEINTNSSAEYSDDLADLPMAETFPIDADVTETVTEGDTFVSTDSVAGNEDITYYSLDDSPVVETISTETVAVEPVTGSYESLPDAETYPVSEGMAEGVYEGEIFSDSGTTAEEYYTLDDPIDNIDTTSTYEVMPGYDAGETISGEEFGYGGEYHVQKGDTLWDIASSNVAGVTAQQMMIALLRANPDAFVDGNINRLRSGYILRIPDAGSTGEIPGRQAALAEVKSQNALWNEYRGVMAKNATGQQMVAGSPAQPVTKPNEEVKAATPSGSAKKDVSIVVPNVNDGKLIQLEKEIAFAREEQESAERKNSELNQQIAELQGLIEKKDQLIAMQGQGSEGANPEDTLKIQQLESAVSEVKDDLNSATMNNTTLEETIVDLKAQLKNKDTEIALKNTDLAQIQAQLKQQETGTEPTIVEEPSFWQNLKQNSAIMYGGAAFLALLGLLLGMLSLKKKKVRKAVEELHQFEANDIPEELDDMQPRFTETGILEMDDEIQSEFGQESQLDPDVEVTGDDLLSDADHVLNNLDDTASLDSKDFTADFAPEDTNVIHAEFGDEDVTEADLTGEFPIMDDSSAESSSGANANEEDELLAEVDIYLAYGLHDQVIEELKPRLEEEPGREDYQIRLFKAYHEKKDKEVFAREAEVLKSTISTSSQLWKDVAVLGYSLDPSNVLYAAGDGSAISASDLMPDKPVNLDVDVNKAQGGEVDNDSMGFYETEVIEPYSVSPEELAALDDDVAIEDELVETVILEETGLHDLRKTEVLKADSTTESTTSINNSTNNIDSDAETREYQADSMEFSLDDVVPDGVDLNETGSDFSDLSSDSTSELGDRKLSEETTEFEFDLASMKGLDATSSGSTDGDATAFLTDIDLEDPTLAPDSPDSVQETSLDDLDFDVVDSGLFKPDAQPDLSQTIRITDEDKESLSLSDALEGIEGDFPMISGDDDMNTKLDLAKAYVDMGDDEGARDALKEVISSGNEQQKVEAERLLNQLT